MSNETISLTNNFSPLSWLTTKYNEFTAWFCTTRVWEGLKWCYDKLTNPSINFLVGVLSIILFELVLGMFGLYGLWPYLLGALLCSTVMFLRLDELPSDKKFAYLVFWYLAVNALTVLNPMGWWTTILLVDSSWLGWFMNGTVVSAIYSIPVSLGVAVLSYNK